MAILTVDCIGCGYCCVAEPCMLSLSIFGLEAFRGQKQSCPALLWTRDRHWCWFALIPSPIGDHYREKLYIGAGCSSSLNSWRKEIVDRRIVPMGNRTYRLRSTVTGEVVVWTIEEILEEINRDRSENWTDYDTTDWKEGLEEWTELELID